jgi:hypothetical protein
MRSRLLPTHGQSTTELAVLLGMVFMVAAGTLAMLNPSIHGIFQRTTECVISDVCEDGTASLLPPMWPPSTPSGSNPPTDRGDEKGPSEAMPECSALEAQLQRDKDAFKEQHLDPASIEKSLQELDEWTKATEEARRDALKTGFEALLGGAAEIANNAELKVKATRDFLQFMQDRHVPNYLLRTARAAVQAAYQDYVNDGILVTSLKAVQVGDELDNAFTLFRNEVALIANGEASGDASIRSAINDPRLRQFLESDEEGRVLLAEFESSLFTTGLPLVVKELGPATSLASFLVDYAYDAKKWATGRAQILQRSTLSETQLNAIRSLSDELKCTVRKLNDCRQGRPITSCHAEPTPVRFASCQVLQPPLNSSFDVSSGGTVKTPDVQTDYQRLIGECSARVQNPSIPYRYDGCSVPPVLSAVGTVLEEEIGKRLFHKSKFPDYTGDFNEPLPGVKFSDATSAKDSSIGPYRPTNSFVPTKACDLHDQCYQTPGSNRQACDQLLYDTAVKTCNDNIIGDQRKLNECREMAKTYRDMLSRFGEPAYEEDQVRNSLCCRVTQ